MSSSRPCAFHHSRANRIIVWLLAFCLSVMPLLACADPMPLIPIQTGAESMGCSASGTGSGSSASPAPHIDSGGSNLICTVHGKKEAPKSLATRILEFAEGFAKGFVNGLWDQITGFWGLIMHAGSILKFGETLAEHPARTWHLLEATIGKKGAQVLHDLTTPRKSNNSSSANPIPAERWPVIPSKPWCLSSFLSVEKPPMPAKALKNSITSSNWSTTVKKRGPKSTRANSPTARGGHGVCCGRGRRRRHKSSADRHHRPRRTGRRRHRQWQDGHRTEPQVPQQQTDRRPRRRLCNWRAQESRVRSRRPDPECQWPRRRHHRPQQQYRRGAGY